MDRTACARHGQWSAIAKMARSAFMVGYSARSHHERDSSVRVLRINKPGHGSGWRLCGTRTWIRRLSSNPRKPCSDPAVGPSSTAPLPACKSAARNSAPRGIGPLNT